MKRALFLSLILITGCTKIFSTDSTPTQPSPTKYKVEFRVIGQQVIAPVAIKHSDGINGLTIYNGSIPYQASFMTDQDSIFVTIDANASGSFLTSSLQVQVFVNGQLFREGFSQGFFLQSSASGTYHR